MPDDPTQPLPPTGGGAAPPPPPTARPAAWSPPPRRGNGRTVALVVVAVVAMVGMGLAGLQTFRLRDARDDVTRLQARVAELEVEVEDLEDRPTGDGGADDLQGLLDAPGLQDLMDGLLDDPAVQDMLDELLQGDGLEGLFGQGGLDELFGEGGLDGLFGEGGLDGLLGGDAADLAACVGMPSGSSEPLPDDPEAAITTIANQVQTVRGLSFTSPVDPTLLSRDELSDRVVELTREDYSVEAADLDARVLTALGAVPPGTDLRQLTLDLLGEQVAGFYDPETGELVALDAAGFDPTTQITLAHELDHALTDQALGLPDLESDTLDADAALGALAVVEGDATLLMQRWAARHLSISDQLAASGDPAAAQQLGSVPHVLAQQLLFPYLEGMGFVCDHFRDGGWAAVDALYDELPTTSAQVLWPERYRDGEAAADPRDPSDPGGAWEQQRTDTLGAAELLWLLEAPGDDTSQALSLPAERAAAWAGGEVTLWTRGGDTAVGLALSQRPGERSLCDTMSAWYRAAFPAATVAPSEAGERLAVDGPSQDAVVTCPGDEVRIGIAPDLATARLLVR